MEIRKLHYLGLALLVWSQGSVAVAQSQVALETRQAKLLELSEQLYQKGQADKEQVQAFSRAAGIPITQQLPGGGVLELQRIIPGLGPVFYISSNVDAADTVSTDELYPGASTGLNLEGAGMIVGEWDVGDVDAAHSDFFGRLTDMDGATGISGRRAGPEIARHGLCRPPQFLGLGFGFRRDGRGRGRRTAFFQPLIRHRGRLGLHRQSASGRMVVGWRHRRYGS